MTNRSTMNVSLTPELARFVRGRVKSGRYQTASEVVREALRLLEARDRAPVAGIEEMKKAIEAGLAPLRRGEGVDGRTYLRNLRAEVLRRLDASMNRNDALGRRLAE